MRHLMIMGLAFSLTASIAQAEHFGFDDFDFGEHRAGFLGGHWSEHPGGDWWSDRLDYPLGGLGLWGPHPGLFGHHRFDILGGDWQQNFFERRFDHLTTEYDEGVADVEDFYNSEEYQEILNRAERLIDQHDFFISMVERTIDRIDDWIAIANDDLTFYQDLLEEYQGRDDLSEKWLTRIEDWLTRAEERTTMKIDMLTTRQTTLTENLPTYQAFHGELTDWLAQIIADATPPEAETTESVLVQLIAEATEPGAESTESVPMHLVRLSAVSEPSVPLAMVSMNAVSVPEPATWILLAMVVTAGALHRRAIWRLPGL